MGENPKMAGHKAMLQGHVDEAASYGGHDGAGGPQRPRGAPWASLRNPAGVPVDNKTRSENKVPVAGPASMVGSAPKAGPGGAQGGSSGA